MASSPRTPRIPAWSRALTYVFWLGAAYLLGYWWSQWAAPRSMPGPQASLAASLVAAGPAAQQAAESLEQMLSASPNAPPTPLETAEVKLSGVLVAGAQSAIVAAVSGERPRVYAIGEALSATLRLQEVRENVAVLRRSDGKLIVVELPERETLVR